jgi:L-ascorbate metabolism protein UlaG (beta-lactamase superfamily)
MTTRATPVSAAAPSQTAGARNTHAAEEGWRERATDHFDPVRQRFFNPWAGAERGLSDLLRWWATADRKPWPASLENRVYPPAPATVPPGQAGVTFVGHASLLVRVGGITVLTDPHFSTHAGVYGRFGAPRVRRPGIEPGDLPPIDVVFVSHCHYDHLDVPSLTWLARHRAPRFVTCLGVKRVLEAEGIARVTELDWWEATDLGEATLTVTPAQHWSNRFLVPRNATLWGGCLLRHDDGAAVYFAADTGYAPFFGEIRERLGAPGVALLPIGAYEPRWFMRAAHMSPDDAVRAHLDLGAGTSIGMHFGFFRLTDEGFDQPLRDLDVARRAHDVAPEAFRTLDVGESAVLPARVADLRRA